MKSQPIVLVDYKKLFEERRTYGYVNINRFVVFTPGIGTLDFDADRMLVLNMLDSVWDRLADMGFHLPFQRRFFPTQHINN